MRDETEPDGLFRETLAAILEAIAPGAAPVPDPDALLAARPELGQRLRVLLGRTTVHDPAPENHAAVPAGRLATGTIDQAGLTQSLPGGGREDGLPRTQSHHGPGDSDASPASPPGQRVRYFGDYLLLDVLGQGGMGIVYRARQIRLGREVALKLLLTGAHASGVERQRFQNEAEALARLDHPGIIPIHEVGEQDGLCYFTMKLIPGRSLAKQLSRFRDDPEAAALLIAEVADTVHHAHQRGVLHRDLKPGNIILDAEGRPHLGDFGLARLLEGPSDELTIPGMVLGTPGYLSPEQARAEGDLTTVSDVYGLGATLYALLVGRAPFRGDSVAETIQHVLNDPPEAPSRLNARVPRDLELICLKCLEKEPERRFQSAGAFADELRRFARREPIQTRPTGRAERLGLWCRRNPRLAALSAALVAAVVLGASGITWNWLAVRRERARLALANVAIGRERDLSRAINLFLIDDLFGQSWPSRNDRARGVTVEDALDRASARVGERFPERPDVEAGVRLAIGQAYLQLGRLDKANPQLERAFALTRQVDGPDSVAFLQAEELLASTLSKRGRNPAADPLARDLLARLERTLGRGALATIQARRLLATIAHELGRDVESETMLREALRDATRTLGPDHPETLTILHNLAAVLDDVGRPAEAGPLFRTVLEGRRKLLRPDHPLTISTLTAFGGALVRIGKLGEAEPLLTGALDASRRVNGDGHPVTLAALNNLGSLRLAQNRPADAAPLVQAALEGRRRELGDDHPDTLRTFAILGVTKVFLGSPSAAEPLLRVALEGSRRRPPGPGRDHDLARIELSLGAVLQELGRAPEAEPLLRQSLEALRPVLAADSPEMLRVRGSFAAALVDLGKTEEAVPLLRDLVAARKRVLSPGSWMVASAESLLGCALASRGDHPDAEPLMIGACERIGSASDAPSRAVALAFDRLIAYYESHGQPGKAAAWRSRKPRPAVATPP